MSASNLEEWQLLFDSNQISLNERKRLHTDIIQYNEELDQDSLQIEFMISKNDFQQPKHQQPDKNEEKNEQEKELKNVQNEDSYSISQNKQTTVLQQIDKINEPAIATATATADNIQINEEFLSQKEKIIKQGYQNQQMKIIHENELEQANIIQNNQDFQNENKNIIEQDYQITQRNKIQDQPTNMLDNNISIVINQNDNKEASLSSIISDDSKLIEDRKEQYDLIFAKFLLYFTILYILGALMIW
ncbi:hypothetical protein ABPG72_015216 [Tetrahymena utriculariae]